LNFVASFGLACEDLEDDAEDVILALFLLVYAVNILITVAGVSA
jgi:hypothetical protein